MEAIDEVVSLHGGISQQDISLRLEHQVEDSINCYHTIENGVRRRNPTVEVGTATGVDEDCFTYVYDRGLAGSLNEKYAIVYDENGFRALDLITGRNVPVVDKSGTYMSPYTSETGYSAVTVKDVTFITNRNKEVALNASGSISDSQQEEGFFWIKMAEPVVGYNYVFKVVSKKNGVTTSKTYNVNTTDGEDNELTTDGVATALKNLIVEQAGNTGVTATVISGNIVKVYATNEATTSILEMSCYDSYGNLAASTIFKEVTTEDDLPANLGISGCKIIVTGLDNSQDNYYLESTATGWKETVGYSVNCSIDKNTMPHKITRYFDGRDNPYFQIEPIDWNDREVGDEDNAKEPSFIGTSITDVCFYKNRLGLLTPYSILFSEVGEYYNFWKTTQVTVLDSDRIDTDLDARKAIRLHYVNFLQDDMIIFGDKTQFRVASSSTGFFSATTINATIISEYGFNPKVKPIAIDNKLIFCAKNNDYNAVYMYEKDGTSDTNKAENITKHIPYLLDGDIAQCVGSSVNSVLFFRSETQKNTLYVYKYLEDGGELVQSSWFKWTIAGDIHSIFSAEGQLYLLTSRNEVLNDLDWIMWDGLWDDIEVWNDEGVWSDAGYLKASKLEVLDIIPKEVTDTYYDVGNVDYTSSITLSEYLPVGSDNKKRLSDKINLKTIYVKADNDSIFRLRINSLSRNTERIIGQEYVLGKRPYIMGRAKDTRITIDSVEGNGFEVNGIAIEARINNRSKGI